MAEEVKIIGNIVNNVVKGIQEGNSAIALQGSARCFAPGTRVRMFDGRLKNIEDIHVGDKVMSMTGDGFNTVTETHSGIDMMYRIVQPRGEDYIVNSQHILSLRQTGAFITHGANKVRKKIPYDKTAILDMPICNYLVQSKNFKENFAGFKNTMIVLPKQDLKIDPYYLGMWLGDGTSKAWYEITNIDKEVLDWFYAFAESLDTKAIQKDAVRHKMIVYNDEGIRSSNLNDKVRDMAAGFKYYNLFNNKHVPEEYIYGDYEDRLKLLAGLVDTDGTNTGRNTLSISQKNRQILEAVLEICRLSGFYSNGIREKVSTMKRDDGSVYKCKTYFIEINHSNFNDLNKYIRVPRKRIESKDCSRDYFTTGIKVEEVGLGEYFGFTLNNEPHFLLADGTVVHNSGKTRNLIIFIIMLCVNPGLLNDLMKKFYPSALKRWEDAVSRGLIDPEEVEDRKPMKPDVVNSVRVSIVRGSLPVLKRSVYQDDFVPVMRQMGLWNEKQMNKTEMTYTFTNGSFIEFFGTDGPVGAQKSRGPSRDILFCNEANEIEEENFKQMKMRTRMFTLLDFNPSFTEEHWLFREMNAYSTYHFISTFRDNPFLTTAIKEEIYSYKQTNPALWEIYGLGHFAIVEGLVFPKGTWDIVEETSIPVGIKIEERIGMDIGFSGKGDPTVAVDCKYANIAGFKHVWIKEIMYERGLNEQQVAYRIKQYNGIKKYIDSSNPLYIQNLRDNGVQLLYPVKKYPNSVLDGITKCQGYKIHLIKGQCYNIEKEFRNYCWIQDGHGGYSDTPIDKFNHGMDGFRYATMSDRSARGNRSRRHTKSSLRIRF